jgi:hypothetical protein
LNQPCQLNAPAGESPPLTNGVSVILGTQHPASFAAMVVDSMAPLHSEMPVATEMSRNLQMLFY